VKADLPALKLHAKLLAHRWRHEKTLEGTDRVVTLIEAMACLIAQRPSSTTKSRTWRCGARRPPGSGRAGSRFVPSGRLGVVLSNPLPRRTFCVASGGLAEEIERLRAEPGEGDIAIGGVTLAAEAELVAISQGGRPHQPASATGGS
jgi:hypothetical protein